MGETDKQRLGAVFYMGFYWVSCLGLSILRALLCMRLNVKSVQWEAKAFISILARCEP